MSFSQKKIACGRLELFSLSFRRKSLLFDRNPFGRKSFSGGRSSFRVFRENRFHSVGAPFVFFLDKTVFCGLEFFFAFFSEKLFSVCWSFFRVLFGENRFHSVGALFVVFPEKIAFIRL